MEPCEKKIKRGFVQFFCEMVTNPATGHISHRRVISFFSFIILFILVALEVFITLTGSPHIVSPDLIYTYAGLCGVQSGLTSFESRKTYPRTNIEEISIKEEIPEFYGNSE